MADPLLQMAERPIPGPGWARRTLALALVVLVVAFADQATKYLAVSHLTRALEGGSALSLTDRIGGFYAIKNLDNDPLVPGRSDLRRPATAVFPSFWHFKYVENPGAAWGLLSRLDERWRLPFFHVISLVAIGIILLFHRRLEPGQRRVAFALSLVLGGAIGNYIDRLMRGYVIDFVDWHLGASSSLHWPTFNVADAAICAGVGLMLLDSFLAPKAEPLAEARVAESPAPATPDLPPMDSKKEAV